MFYLYYGGVPGGLGGAGLVSRGGVPWSLSPPLLSCWVRAVGVLALVRWPRCSRRCSRCGAAGSVRVRWSLPPWPARPRGPRRFPPPALASQPLARARRLPRCGSRVVVCARFPALWRRSRLLSARPAVAPVRRSVPRGLWPPGPAAAFRSACCPVALSAPAALASPTLPLSAVPASRLSVRPPRRSCAPLSLRSRLGGLALRVHFPALAAGGLVAGVLVRSLGGVLWSLSRLAPPLSSLSRVGRCPRCWCALVALARLGCWSPASSRCRRPRLLPAAPPSGRVAPWRSALALVARLANGRCRARCPGRRRVAPLARVACCRSRVGCAGCPPLWRVQVCPTSRGRCNWPLFRLLPALPLVPALVAGRRARAPGAVRAGCALVCAVPAVRCVRPGAGHLWRGAAVPLVRLVRSRLSRSRPVALVLLPRTLPTVALLARLLAGIPPKVFSSNSNLLLIIL